MICRQQNGLIPGGNEDQMSSLKRLSESILREYCANSLGDLEHQAALCAAGNPRRKRGSGAQPICEMIRRDVNHPCIIAWDNGNEGGWNRDLGGGKAGNTNFFPCMRS